jgi:hypothetical protein
MTKSIAIAVVCCLATLVGVDQTALAQAGSTGGAIGKTDKAASGGEEPRTTARTSIHNSGREQSLPQTIRLTERAPTVTFSVTLQRSGGRIYEGTISHGYVTIFTMVNFTTDTVKMTRNDNPTWGSVTGTYVGHRAGNSATGRATISNALTTTWDASW